MKAVFFTEHGGPEVLRYDTLEAPQPGPGEIQVQIHAAAVNHLDIWVRNGWPGIRLEYPHIPGGDGAGLVSAVGEGVTSLAVGDRVVLNGTTSCGMCEYCLAGQDNMCRQGGRLGETQNGTYAEYIAVPERNAIKLPEHISFAEGAASSLVFLSAWHSLITRGNIRPGESVLVVGAGGGLNTAAIQIAKLTGCYVFVVGSTDEKLARAQELGADITINRYKQDWGQAVYQVTGKRGVDVVVDNVGQETWATSLRALGRGGRMLVVGNTSGYDVQIDSRYVFGKHISIIGSTMSTHEDFRQVMRLIFRGKLKAVIGETLSLREARTAHELLESGSVFGKIVLLP